MRIPQLLIGAFVLILSCKTSQSQTSDERLYDHVDSLITKVLNYEYNENSFAKPVEIDSTVNRPIHTSHSTLPRNPEPIILLDGNPSLKEDLKKLPMELIKKIELIEPSDATAALYGLRGSNGAIILTTTKFKPKRKTEK